MNGKSDGKIMKEFARLLSKMYSIIVNGGYFVKKPTV